MVGALYKRIDWELLFRQDDQRRFCKTCANGGEGREEREGRSRGRAEREVFYLSWVSLAAVLRGVPPPPGRAPENAPSTHLLARVLGLGPKAAMMLPLNCCSSCTSFGLWLFLLAPAYTHVQTGCVH